MRPKADTSPALWTDGATFHTTHWSLVLAARDGSDAEGRTASDRLCRDYWRPVYAYIRRVGFSPVDAQDLTQGFFAHFLEHNFLQRLQHCDGRFRSFLLLFVRRFPADERDKAGATKGGGDLCFIPWDDCAAAATLRSFSPSWKAMGSNIDI